MITKLQLRLFVFFSLVVLSVLGQDCDTFSSSNYFCNNDKKPQETCTTYAILRANSHYSSLSNLSSYLSIPPSDLAEANAFSNDVESLSEGQPVLVPIECKCSNGGFFEAEVKKITAKGDSFYQIGDSLEGLTTCKAIREKNPNISQLNLEEGISISVPLQCSCPSPDDLGKILVSYPVKEGDTLPELAVNFNVSAETLVSANQRHSRSGFRQYNNLVPISTILIPLQEKPVLGFLQKSQDPSWEHPAESIRVKDSHKRRKKPKMWLIGVYIAIGLAGFLACVAISVAFFFIHWKKRREESFTKTDQDLERQQLSLSIRTTSDKKVSFEGSQYNFDDNSVYTTTTTPHKTRVESYTFEDLQKATEDFSVSCLIEASVFHGRLKGKNLAIKRLPTEQISKIDSQIFQERIHHHPNIVRLLGTCLMDGPDSYLVLEYAKNGSLKDWIHGGLAIKSHFIASCSCFLTWNQRVKICLDVATALQHMHHIMNPTYVHRNIKSRNIFLDEDFSAKIGNFGMAKLADDDDQEPCQGYLSPESLSQGTISPSTDIFAYGVVLLEVLSGKPPVARDEEAEDGKVVKLSDEIQRVLKLEDAEELRGWIDGALGESYSFDGAVMLANLARSCVEEDPSSRPTAGEIVEKLLRLVEELPEGDQFNICESSCKPLVKAAANGV